MKAVLISMQPKWCEFIAANWKWEEIRKSKPMLNLPFKCYIYQTKHKWLYNLLVGLDRLKTAQVLADGLCKVIGEFVCDEIKPVHFNSLEKETICALAVGNGDSEWYKGSCVSYKDAYRYLKSAKKAYAWHISNLKIYDEPKSLRDFHKVGYSKTKNSVFGWTVEEETSWQISRPPQSWCYVEELNDGR